MNVSRRYEILLPLRFNDGTRVPQELAGETLLELKRQFGAITWESQTIRGLWEHGGQIYQDDSMRLIIDVDDSLDNREFFGQFKERLKARFKQIDIRMTTHIINVV